MIDFVCKRCYVKLIPHEGILTCDRCGYQLPQFSGVFVDPDFKSESDQDFYNTLYNDSHGQKWLQGLNRVNVFKKILERISLSYRRERFFRRFLKGKENMILDLACGAGRDYFKNFGYVVGVDFASQPLQIAKLKYDLVVQGGVGTLPFADNTFDYVLSADFFGHVRPADKDSLRAEILRVLKPGGITLHVIETDSDNFWYKIAHRHSVLFQKYFVEKIGGHVGLELPSRCVGGWEKAGYEILYAKKIWSLIWPVQDFAGLFGNEYRDRFPLLKILATIAVWISRVKLFQVFTNIILNPISWLIDQLTPLDSGTGLLLVAKKPIFNKS